MKQNKLDIFLDPIRINKNILDEGMRIISAGAVDYTGGGKVRLASKHPPSPMKSESHKSLVCG